MLQRDERVTIIELSRRGWSITQIARETGRDRKTVRRAIVAGPDATARLRRPKPRKLTPYEPYLATRLAEGMYNARTLYYELQQRGYTGGETLVRDYVRQRRPTAAASPSS